MTLKDRFWTRVNQNGPVPSHQPELGPCWLWTGTTATGGYGTLQRGKRGEGLIRAHRFSYEIHFGPIPNGMDVMHRCDVRACVRPSHLLVGTKTDNNRDMAAKGRHVGSRKLTLEQVTEIRRRYTGAPGEQRVLAREFGTSPSNLNAILRGKRWGPAPDVRPILFKLSDDQVAEVRRRYTGARGEQRALAREFGVSEGYMSQLLHGRAERT